jgi:hypothetical protein
VAEHIYTQTIHITTQITTNVEECVSFPIFASFALAFALQRRKKHRKASVSVKKTSVVLIKTSVRVECTYYQNTHTYGETNSRFSTISLQSCLNIESFDNFKVNAEEENPANNLKKVQHDFKCKYRQAKDPHFCFVLTRLSEKSISSHQPHAVSGPPAEHV